MNRLALLALTAGLCGCALPGRSVEPLSAPPNGLVLERPPPQPATPARMVRPEAVAVPAGWVVEVAASGLDRPDAVAFDEAGRLHVVERNGRGSRLVRIDGGATIPVASGSGKWTGIDHWRGSFYVAEARGALLRITADGAVTALAEGLPSGEHGTTGPAIGPDGWVYFGQGTATNAGVAGAGGGHDVPCHDLILEGRNFPAADPRTGAFSPYGKPTAEGEVVFGQVPCSGAVLRVPPGGGPVELVAWGLRNPVGLAFAADGRLHVSDQGFQRRGARPVPEGGTMLWAITWGAWYGWPDWVAGRPVAEPVLADHPNRPPRPLAVLSAGSSGLDFSRAPAFGAPGLAFVADHDPDAAWPGRGRLLAISPATGEAQDFAVNRAPMGGLECPVALRFDPSGAALYLVDAGLIENGAIKPDTGVVWRIRRP